MWQCVVGGGERTMLGFVKLLRLLSDNKETILNEHILGGLG